MPSNPNSPLWPRRSRNPNKPTPYLYIYIIAAESPTGNSAAIVIGDGGRKVKSASKREQNKFIYYVEPTQERTQNQTCLNYAERQGGRQDVNSEQIQDRKAGLKVKGERLRECPVRG